MLTHRKSPFPFVIHITATSILAFFLLFTISCSTIDEEEIIVEEVPEESIRYLALGDSYTIGQGVMISERWPIQLGQALEGLDYNVDSIHIIAQTGWTTGNLLQAVDITELNDFNLVSLLIGVNNQFQNQSFTIFQEEFIILLNKSIDYAGSEDRVFVVSIPDYGVTPFGSANSEMIAEELDMYNNYISLKCGERNIPFIDITAISRDLGASNGALATDNLHPSGSQYKLWVDKILPEVIDLLGK